MDYTFKIDNINQLEERVGVVYIPGDESLTPRFVRVAVNDFDPVTVEKAIILNAPIEIWALEIEKRDLHGSDFQRLVGTTKASNDQATLVSRQEEFEKVPLTEIARDLKEHLKGEVTQWLNQYRHKYAPEEVELWDKLHDQALVVVNESEGDTSLLSAMATAKEITLREFAEKVISKHNRFEQERETTVINLKAAEVTVDRLITQFNARELSRRQVLEAFDKLPLYQPVTEETL